MASKATKPPRSANDSTKTNTGPKKADKGRFDRIKMLKAEAMSLGISEEGIESWISTTFKGKPKKELDGNEIKMTEAYLVGIIRDKKALNG